MTHFRKYQKIMKNNEIFYLIIDSCKNIVSVKYKRLEIAKKNRPSWLYQAKNRSNIAKVGLKRDKSFKIHFFLVNMIRKTKTSL